VGRFQRDIKGT